MDSISTFRHIGKRAVAIAAIATVVAAACFPASALRADAADRATGALIGEQIVRLDGYYSMLTPSGSVVALNKDSISDGAGMKLKQNSPKSVGLQFFFISSKNGYHAVKSSISFKALTIDKNSKNEGTRLVQKAYAKAKGQRFKIEPAGSGRYLLRSALGPYVSAVSDGAGAKLITTNDRAKALTLRFKKAKYSTGMAKLDKKIRAAQKKIGNKGDVLKKSFKYVIDHYDYRDHKNNFKGNWINRYAYSMMDTKKGHCKNFAATVCLLFRAYGYDARMVTGRVQSRSRGWVVHGWVEADIKGKTYIFDPSFANSRGIKGWYKRTYKNALTVLRIEKRW